MNKGAFLDGLNKGKKLLRLSEINFSENTKFSFDLLSPSKFSDEFIRKSQSNDYDLIHKTALENGDYDLLLDDYSFFQFSLDVNGVLRYAFYESSRKIPTYEQFLEEVGFSSRDYTEIDSFERPFFDDYEQMISEAKLKNSVTPIRYDYNEAQYLSIVHPISHLHIGHDNQIRIPLNIILTPQAFIGFVVKHIYYHKWKVAYNDQTFLETYLSNKASCLDLDQERFNLDEKKDLYLL